MSTRQRAEALPPAHRILEEGLVTGLVGAGLVAVWFLVLDSLRGEPFLTPTMLGGFVFDGLAATEIHLADTKTVFAYSGLHVILFLLVGWGLAWMFQEFDHHPHFGIAYLLGFLMFEIIIFGIEISMVPDFLGVVGTWAVAVGNVLSAAGMFWFLWRRHPNSLRRLGEAWQS